MKLIDGIFFVNSRQNKKHFAKRTSHKDVCKLNCRDRRPRLSVSEKIDTFQNNPDRFCRGYFAMELCSVNLSF